TRNYMIVSRTFSKAYGLAGLRIGYAVAPPDLAQKLGAERLANSISGLALRAAKAALDDDVWLRAYILRNINERQEFFNKMNARMISGVGSHTNFILARSGRPAADVIRHFRDNGILIGRDVPSMPRYVRVSLGKPDDMDEFWRVWDLLIGHKM